MSHMLEKAAAEDPGVACVTRLTDAMMTARLGAHQFYVVESITASPVMSRIHVVVRFDRSQSVTLSIAQDRVEELIEALQKAQAIG